MPAAVHQNHLIGLLQFAGIGVEHMMGLAVAVEQQDGDSLSDHFIVEMRLRGVEISSV